MMRTAIKQVRHAIDAGDQTKANEAFVKATSIIDRAVDKHHSQKQSCSPKEPLISSN